MSELREKIGRWLWEYWCSTHDGFGKPEGAVPATFKQDADKILALLPEEREPECPHSETRVDGMLRICEGCGESWQVGFPHGVL